MAPRKSTNTPETSEGKGSAKATPGTRAKKADIAEKKASLKPTKARKDLPTPKETAKPEKPMAGVKRGRKPKAVAEVVIEPVTKPAAPGKSRKVSTELAPQVQTILQAIQEGRAVEFLFTDPDTNPPRTFEPRQLIFDVFTKAWFVWGWDRRYNAERHHRVDLLAEVNPVEGVGRAAQGPYKDGTPGNQIGGWLGGEPIPVKAILLKQWIYAVKQAPALFPDFRLEDLEEGKAQVSFVGTDLRAIARWCMQFGDGIQVLEPQRLIDRIKQVGVSWAGKPAQAPSPTRSPAHEHRPEPRPDHPRKSEHTRHETKEHRESREPREFKEAREPDARESGPAKNKPGKVEIRIDRL